MAASPHGPAARPDRRRAPDGGADPDDWNPDERDGDDRQCVAVGIDFGTEFSSVARLGRTGDADLLPDRRGRVLNPSGVRLLPGGRLGVVGDLPDAADEGDAAADGADAERSRRVEAVKRLLEHPAAGVPDPADPEGGPLHDADGDLSAELLSAAVFRGLLRDVRPSVRPDAPVVLTVPTSFTRTPRAALAAAGRVAGLNVTDTLTETTAAALAYHWEHGPRLRGGGSSGAGTSSVERRGRYMLVFDLGAGTFDAAVVRLAGRTLEVIAAQGDHRLGGRDWTDRFAAFAADRFAREHGCDPRRDPAARRALFARCDAAKQQLTEREAVVLSARCGGDARSLEVTRGQFEEVTAPLLNRTRDLTEFLLDTAGLEPDRLDVVLPIGGGTQMPGVRRMLTELVGRPPDAAGNPRTAVARGAAVYSAKRRLDRGEEDCVPARVRADLAGIEVREVSTHSVGVAIESRPGRASGPPKRVNHVVLPRNRRLPAEVRKRFATTVGSPHGVVVALVEGEAPEADACDRLGEWRIRGLPDGLPAGTFVEVRVLLDEHRVPRITARLPGLKRKLSVERVIDPSAEVRSESAARERLERLLDQPR